MKRILSAALAALLLGAPAWQALHAQDDAIVVTGEREKARLRAASLAKAITSPPPAGTPLARQYQPLCLRVFGIQADVAAIIADRIADNARSAGVIIAKPGCQANAFLGVFRGGRGAVERLRKEQPWLFETMLRYEVDRVFAGTSPVYAWHATEVRSVDGRPLPTGEIDIGGRKAEVKMNNQYAGGRLVSPIRADVTGSIVLIEGAATQGKTAGQIADYASMRLLAPLRDAPADRHGVETILSLFDADASPPGELTTFDRAYLRGFYRLGPGAGAAAMHDATMKAYADAEKAVAADPPAG